MSRPSTNKSIYTSDEHGFLRSDTSTLTNGIDWKTIRKNSDAIRLALNVSLIKTLKAPQDFETLIIYAILNNQDRYLESIFRECKIDLESLLKDNIFLHLAAQRAHLKTFDILIANGCSPLATDDDDNYFLNCVFEKNQSSNFLNEYFTVLTKNGNGEALKTLLLQRDNKGDNAFDLAVRDGYLNSVKELKKHAGNINYQKNLNDSVDHHHPAIFAFLLNDLNPDILTPEDIAEITNHITQNLDGKTRPVIAKVFRTFLLKHELAIQEIEDLVNNVNIEELSDGFHFICANYGSEYLEICLDKVKQSNGDVAQCVNQASEEGKSPLFYATQGKGYVRNIQLLLEQGANPNFVGIDNDGEEIDILGLAIKNIHPASMVAILKSTALDSESVSNAAKRIVQTNNAELIKSFILNLNEKQFFALEEADQQELLDLAIECGFEKSVDSIQNFCLLENPDHFIKLMNSPLPSGLLPLQLAIICGDLKMIEKVAPHIDAKAKVNDVNIDFTSLQERRRSIIDDEEESVSNNPPVAIRPKDVRKMSDEMSYMDYAKSKNTSPAILEYLDWKGFKAVNNNECVIS
jgi:ankyrin repeat protein